MTINERIKEIRRSSGLSQTDFAERLGTTRGVITNLEGEKTSPNEPFIKLICREFNVNEDWLRTGEGEMLEQTRASVLDRLSTEYDLSREQRSVIEAFLDLDPQERDVILKYVHNVFDRSAESAAQSTAIPNKEAQRIAESDEFKALREKNEPPESESCTTAG